MFAIIFILLQPESVESKSWMQITIQFENIYLYLDVTLNSQGLITLKFNYRIFTHTC